jgi:hypothetical protein
MSRWGGYVGRFVEGSQMNRAVGFMTEYSLPENEDQARLSDLKRPDGLIGWHTVTRSPGGLRLFCYWTSKDAFERDESTWQAAMGTGCTLIDKGLVGKFAPEKGHFIRWTTVLQTVVLALAGVLAAMTTIRNASDTIFASPHITLKDDRKPINVLESEDIQTKPVLVNQIQTTNTDVSVSAILVDMAANGTASTSGKQTPMQVSEAKIPELAGGEKRDLTIAGKAPPPGKYVIKIAATSNAGAWRSAQTVEILDDVRVWPTHPQPQPLVLFNSTPTIAKFDAAVDIGPASEFGVECALDIAGLTDVGVVIAPVSAIQVTQIAPLISGTQNSGIYHLVWNFPAKTPMETVRFKFMMRRITETDWTKVMRSTQLACNYASAAPSKSQGSAK